MKKAVEEAICILLLVDYTSGLHGADKQIAAQLRKVKDKVFLVVNKVDDVKRADLLGDFYKRFSNLISTLTIIHFISISLAFSILIYSFVVSDFTIQNVWENSHTLKPMIYKITGSWGSHEGSMLLWCWVMALYGFIISINYQLLNSITKSLVLMSQGILSLQPTSREGNGRAGGRRRNREHVIRSRASGLEDRHGLRVCEGGCAKADPEHGR